MLSRPDQGLDILLDCFLVDKNPEELDFIERHVTLFLKSGQAAIDAPDAIKRLIRKNGRN